MSTPFTACLSNPLNGTQHVDHPLIRLLPSVRQTEVTRVKFFVEITHIKCLVYEVGKFNMLSHQKSYKCQYVRSGVRLKSNKSSGVLFWDMGNRQ